MKEQKKISPFHSPNIRIGCNDKFLFETEANSIEPESVRFDLNKWTTNVLRLDDSNDWLKVLERTSGEGEKKIKGFGGVASSFVPAYCCNNNFIYCIYNSGSGYGDSANTRGYIVDFEKGTKHIEKFTPPGESSVNIHNAMAVSPDGKYLYFAYYRYKEKDGKNGGKLPDVSVIYFMKMNTETFDIEKLECSIVTPGARNASVSGLQVSKDGKFLYGLTLSGVFSIDLETMQKEGFFQLESNYNRCISFQNLEKWLYVITRDKILLLNAPSLSLEAEISPNDDFSFIGNSFNTNFAACAHR